MSKGHSRSDRQAAPPECIGERYEVVRLLGRGGMGEVYEVVDGHTGARIALKRVSIRDGQRRAGYLRELFAREFRVLRELDHPSVIPVHDFGVESADSAYYTMELLTGTDLQHGAPIAWATACQHLRDVASCLALLHSRKWLHRDVSPRNVKLDAQGRARLIDFGAMAPMGSGQHVVGTPPLMPPEAVHGQNLDARCDLYALGGTLYWALTGRHAYPARTIAELPLMWQQQPEPPSAYASDVPPALDGLVMTMLSLDQDARPRHAAEVIERLGAIAGLEDDAALHVSQSYLTAPTLVGRQEALTAIQESMDVSSTRSQAVVVTAEPGVGRSRLLDAATVEALLSGARVLRIHPGSSQRPLDAAQSLLAQCSDGEADPDNGGRSHSDPPNPDADAPVDRPSLMAQVRRQLRHMTATGRVVLVADDLHLLDQDSRAFVANLPDVCRKRLLLLASAPADAPLPSNLHGARDHFRRVQLAPLSAAEAYALLASIFGDDARLAPIADRIHQIAQGNPGAMLELAQHLVDRGAVRYRLGGWALPDALGDGDLPPAWTDAIVERISLLSPAARAVAQALAIAAGHLQHPGELERLLPGAQAEELRAAVDRLAEAGVVRMDGARPQLSNGGHLQAIRGQITPDTERELCGNMAELLLRGGREPVLASDYLQRAGHPSRAIEVLSGALSCGSLAHEAPHDYPQVLRRAVDDADALRKPRRQRFGLLQELVRVLERRGARDQHVYFTEIFRQLSADSGLNTYWQLPATMPPTDRLQEALRLSQQTWESLQESERGLPPLEALQAIAEAAQQALSVYVIGMDAAVGACLPDLTPLRALSPAIAMFVDLATPAAHATVAGRYEEAYQLYQRIETTLHDGPESVGLGQEQWQWSTAQVAFAMGHIMAGLGVPKALAHAEVLDTRPGWEMEAWDIRRAFHLRVGDIKTADRCRRRIARLQLETGQRSGNLQASARLELDTAAHACDIGLARRAMERLQPLLDGQPGYAPYGAFGPGVQAFIRGNYSEALGRCEQALTMTRAGKHPTWPWIAGCYLESLLGLQRTEDAHGEARRLLADAETVGLRVMAHHISLPMAQAEALLGQTAEAAERVDAAIAYREQLGCQGLNLGWAYEHRARVAITAMDTAAFLAAVSRCGEEYGKGRAGSTLVGRYEQLMAHARARGLLRPTSPPPANGEGDDPASEGAVSAQFRGLSDDERAVRALEILTKEAGASAGALYRYTETGVELSATLGRGRDPLPGIEAVAQLMPAHTELESDITTASDATLLATVRRSGNWQPLGLGHRDRRRGYCRTGVALLQYEAHARAVSPHLLTSLSREITSTAATTVS